MYIEITPQNEIRMGFENISHGQERHFRQAMQELGQMMEKVLREQDNLPSNVIRLRQ